MGRNVSVQPLLHIGRKLLPVGVASAESGAERRGAARRCGVPNGLVARITDVLWSAGDGEDRRRLAIVKEVVGILELLLPGALTVASRELDVIEGELVLNDRLFSVKERQDLVAFLNLSLVGGDRDNLTPLEALLDDPVTAVVRVRLRVSVLKLLEGRVCCGARSNRFRHFNFN